MGIQYVTVQNNRKGGNQLWYGRAVHPATVDLDYLAERIQHNCSMTKGDVLAVLTEMVTVMRYEMQNSNKVKVDGLGTFYMGIRTIGAVSEEKFNSADNIKSFTVNFLAEGRKTNGKIVRVFTEGIKAIKSV